MLSKTVRFFQSLCRIITEIFLLIIFIVVIAQVLFRSLLQIPISWSEEISRYLYVWVVFVGSFLVLCLNGHMSIDVFVNKLPKKGSEWVDIITTLVILGYLLVLTFTGFSIVKLNMTQISPGLKLPMGWAYLAIPCGGLLMFICTISQMVERIKDRRNG